MSRPMWAAPKNTIDEFYIKRDHLDTLQKVVDNACACESISIREVHKALDYFYARVDRKEGLILFQKGLAQKNQDYLKDGLQRLRKNLGE